MQYKAFAACAVLWLSFGGVDAAGQTSRVESKEAEIRSAIESYVTAFNARDAEKLVSHWCPEGVYVSRATGEQVIGREAMAKEFASMLADEAAPKLAVTTESIEFISPNVALERGTAIVTRGDDDADESRYQVVYVKTDGSWLIDRVSEDAIVIEASHYEQLKDLQWMIGEWTDAGEGFVIETSCRWTEHKNFISRTFSVSNQEGAQSSGLQIIGWDASIKQIRSWLFDSAGGFVEGTWNKRDDRWVVQSVATLADGGSGSFTSVFQPTEDGSYRWKKVNRVLDGQLLPSIDEIVVQRK